jgi:hypothetical protein
MKARSIPAGIGEDEQAVERDQHRPSRVSLVWQVQCQMHAALNKRRYGALNLRPGSTQFSWIELVMIQLWSLAPFVSMTRA